MTDSRSPFALPVYRHWFLGSTFQALSMGLTLAVTLTLLAITGSPSVAGALLTCLVALEMVASIVGGVYADSIPRRAIIISATTLSLLANLAVLALILTGATQGGWGLGALCLGLAAVGYGFSDPAFDGALKAIISKEQFPRAMSAAQIRSSTLSIIGNPLAGLLVSLAGFLPFAVKSLCEALFLGSVCRIKVDLGPGGQGQEGRGVLRGLLASYRQAFAYLKTQPAILRILLCAPLLNILVFGTSAWTALYLAGSGASGVTVGWVLAGFAVGAIVGGLLTPAVTDRYRAGLVALVGLGAMIVLYACYFVLAPHPLLMGCAAFFCMLPSPPLNARLFSHVYAVTPLELQGRVHALFTLVGGLGAIAAPLLAGLAVAQGSKLLFAGLVLGSALVGYGLLLASRQVRELP